MDKYGVEMQVLSLTSPGPQGIPPSKSMGNQTVIDDAQDSRIPLKQPNWPPVQTMFSYFPLSPV